MAETLSRQDKKAIAGFNALFNKIVPSYIGEEYLIDEGHTENMLGSAFPVRSICLFATEVIYQEVATTYAMMLHINGADRALNEPPAQTIRTVNILESDPTVEISAGGVVLPMRVEDKIITLENATRRFTQDLKNGIITPFTRY